ncbi:MAG: PspC domain-containing protein, partial [Deltaproteobacteria bacterium]
MPEVASKHCPYCAEEIRAEAVKCRYCGSFLEPGNPLTRTWYRSREGKMIAGVCTGLAEQFGISVTILRLAFVLRAELESWCARVGEPRYRATQVLTWLHRKRAATFDEMSSLSRGLRARLAAEFSLHRIEPAFVAESADGTRKLLFHLPGERGFPAAAIESVLIPQVGRAGGARNRLTLCISSQAGCGMGCRFCATARMGLVRNLRPS